jgi:O-antigen/teichoic acid export membrane protein
VRGQVTDGAHTGLAANLRRLAGQSAVYGLGSLASRLVAVLLLPLYTRYLDPADYGRVELILVFVVIVGIVAKLGLTSAFFRFFFDHDEPERRRDIFRTTFSALLVCATAVALLLAALAGPIAELLFGEAGGEDPARLVLIGALGVWITVLYELMAALFRVQERPLAFSVATVANITLTIGLTVLLVVGLGLRAEGVLLGNFLGSLLVFAGLLVVQRAWLGLRLDRPTLAGMLRFGLPLIPAGAALWAVNMIDRPAVNALAEGDAGQRAHALGIYAISYKLVQGITLLINAFQLSWPAFAYSLRDDDEARRTYAAVLSIYVAGMSWAVLAVGLAAPWLVRLLTTPAYYGAADAVVPLAAGTALYGTYYIAAIGAGRAKRTGRNWLIALAAALVDVALLVALVPRYGIEGAAWAAFAAYAVMVVLMLAWSQRVFPVPYRWGALLRTVALAAALTVAGLVLAPGHGLDAFALRLLVVALFPAGLVLAGVVSRRDLRRVRHAAVPARRRRPA